ncbi:MAG: hydrogen gas-evolving membrane-bound hydrogenase subunit E [Thermodesulfobacteriota bacterium]
MKAVALFICALLGYLLLVAADDFPIWGDLHSPASNHVSPYYIEHSMEETMVPNFVTSILADYRGYDTMFETTVIFCAGITVMSILRRSHRKRDKVVPPRPQRKNADVILREASRLLVPPMQLFALYVVAHGHHSPGGGFQGGVILGASLILLAVSFDLRWVLGRIRERTLLLFAGVGVSIYAGIGALCLVLGGNFLAYGHWKDILRSSEEMAHSHGMLGVEIGVAITVMCIMVSLYLDLASGGELDEGL